ncbi:MAG: tetratricopeptide (TPR) repeat protein [Polyangiales bacterium]|jgi:tetratricopeptide (TPR) repeat protein
MNNQTTDLMRGELERLFELDEMMALSSELLGYEPDAVGGQSGKGTFARALVERAAKDEALEALADAMLFFGKHSPDVSRVFDVRVGDEPEPGSAIGDFTVRKKLADGGLGKVYLAERGEGDDRVRAAIKVIRSSLSRDRSAVARWLTSQRAFQRSAVDGVGKVLGCGMLPDGRPWVAIEFIEGQTLAARIERVGPMHFNEARPIFVGLLEALQSLHEVGLVHSDVKTANVFTTRKELADGSRGEPTGVLIDGGAYRLLAAGASHPDAIGALRVFGNAHAIAPEMARGAAVAAGSDIYAVGVALYEALSGRVPFEGTSAFEVIAQHLERIPEPPSTHAPKGWISKELDELVLRALVKDPADRYRTARELRDAIEALAKSKEKKADLDKKAFEKATKALTKKPGNSDAAAKVEEIAAPAGAWKKAIEAYREAIEKASKDSEKTGLLFRIARIQDAELSDRAGAGETYAAIRELDPSNAIAQNGLEEFARRAGDYEGLAELLLEKVEHVKSTEERAVVLREIAELYEERLGDAENGLVAWTQALADEPKDEKTQRAIERLAGSNAELWGEVLTSLNEAVEDAEPADGSTLYVLMGRWYAERLKRPDFALPCYGQALQLDPGSDEAYEGTTALYKKAQSWQELVQLLTSRADASTNPAAARDYRAEAADIVLRKLGNQDVAIGMFEEVLKDDPAHPMALDAIASIHEERKEWKELAELLTRRVKQSAGSGKVAAHLKLGELYEDRLDQFEKASVQYEAALAVDGTSIDALKGLERVYARTSDFANLLSTLEKQLEVVATPRQKIALLEHIGAIQEEEFVDHEKATTAYESVIAIDGGHEGANVALARLYRATSKFDELVVTLERHAAATSDGSRKIDLMLRAARAFMTDLGAPERAIELCDGVLALDPKNVEALGLGARLKAESGDATAAVAAVDQLAENASDSATRAGHYVEAGKLLEEAGDKDRAIERFKRALEADPGNAPATSALRRLYESRGDDRGAAELLQRELERTDGDLRKAKLHAQLGTLYATRLEDPRRASEAFDAALALDPSSFEAARGLGDMAFAKGDAATAAEYYEPLLSRTGDLDKDVAAEICVRTGDAFRDAGSWDKAQRAYLNARSFAPKDRSILEKVAEVTFEAGEADEAAEFYRQLLKEHGGDITGAERGRMLHRRGDALRRSGEHKEAEKLLKEACELLPEDDAVLDALGSVYRDSGKHEKFITMSRHRMDGLADARRFALLLEIGDVQQEKMGDRQKAAKTYVEALEIVPDDRNLLTKLMGVYSESKDWSRLVEVILRIADLVNEPRQLAKYYFTAASIARRELKRSGEAADYYAQALDHDSGLDKAFDGLVVCLKEEENWSELATAYNAQIRRKADSPPETRASMYDALGELYQDKLTDLAKAADAYETAQELDVEDRGRLEKLVAIYASEPKRFFRKAIDAHGEILRMSPYRVESYQALRQLYAGRKLDDEEWCVCQTLKVLGMAGPDEESVFKEHRSRHPAAAQEFFGEDIWFNHLIHHDQDPLLTNIFAVLTPAALASHGRDLAAYELDGASPRDAASDESAMVKTLAYASGVMKIDLPSIFYRDNDPGGLSMLFTSSPGVGVGKGALAGGPPQALAFVASRHLAYFRSGLLLRQLVGSGSGLRAWLLAAIKFATPGFPVPAKISPRVDTCLESLLKHLDRTAQDKLRGLVSKLLAAAPELDMKKWIAAVDLTADRVGFVMANDLELASAVIKASPEDTMPHNERLKELYLYSASPAYMQLREKIGVSIE